jgi:hypothetical protein
MARRRMESRCLINEPRSARQRGGVAGEQLGHRGLLAEFQAGVLAPRRGRVTLISGLRDRGVSVLLTSHYLVDIEQLANQVVMLERGKVTHEMTVAQFSASVGYAAIIVVRGTGPVPETGGLGPAGIASTQVGSTAESREPGLPGTPAKQVAHATRVTGSAAPIVASWRTAHAGRRHRRC